MLQFQDGVISNRIPQNKLKMLLRTESNIFLLLIYILQSSLVTDVVHGYSYENRIISKKEYSELGPFPCPGLYCGRTLDINESYYSKCGKCDRGWRVGNNTHSICEKCSGTPSKNDWFYLASHVIFVLVLHWVAIDFSAKRRSFSKEVLLLHTCAFFEVAIAAIITGRRQQNGYTKFNIREIKFKHDNHPISLLHLLFFSACDGAVRGDVISVLQGKTTSRLVYILPGMFIFHQPYKRNSSLYYYVRKCY